MINQKKVVVVLSAYNAAKTQKTTYREIDFNIEDEVILVDDMSKDQTIQEVQRLGIQHIISYQENMGYRGNQKLYHNKALELGNTRSSRINCL